MYLCIWMSVDYDTLISLLVLMSSVSFAQQSTLLIFLKDASLFAISLSHTPGQALLDAFLSVTGDVPGLNHPHTPSLLTLLQLVETLIY